MLLLILCDECGPLRFLLRPMIYSFAKMPQRLVGNVELFVFGPAKMSLCFAYCLFAGRIAVGLAGAGRRHAVANYCLH